MSKRVYLFIYVGVYEDHQIVRTLFALSTFSLACDDSLRTLPVLGEKRHMQKKIKISIVNNIN